MDSGIRCHTCKYYHSYNNADNIETGECRYTAPVVVAINDDWATVFPIVEADLWCGLWAPEHD